MTEPKLNKCVNCKHLGDQWDECSRECWGVKVPIHMTVLVDEATIHETKECSYFEAMFVARKCSECKHSLARNIYGQDILAWECTRIKHGALASRDFKSNCRYFEARSSG